eukprot:scaffold95579_cov21-Tisochrysis_lutea.AAC.1
MTAGLFISLFMAFAAGDRAQRRFQKTDSVQVWHTFIVVLHNAVQVRHAFIFILYSAVQVRRKKEKNFMFVLYNTVQMRHTFMFVLYSTVQVQRALFLAAALGGNGKEGEGKERKTQPNLPYEGSLAETKRLSDSSMLPRASQERNRLRSAKPQPGSSDTCLSALLFTQKHTDHDALLPNRKTHVLPSYPHTICMMVLAVCDKIHTMCSNFATSGADGPGLVQGPGSSGGQEVRCGGVLPR